MDQEQIQQILDELLSAFEPLEAQSAAVMQFLKAKGLATDKELAPYLEQAGNAANVRWRAVRVRAAALIANAMKSADEPKPNPAEKVQAPSETASETSDAKSEEKTGSEKTPKEAKSEKREKQESEKPEQQKPEQQKPEQQKPEPEKPKEDKTATGEDSSNKRSSSGQQPPAESGAKSTTPSSQTERKDAA